MSVNPLSLLAILVLLTACAEDVVVYDKEAQLTEDLQVIEASLSENQVQANFHESGFYYSVLEESNGELAEKGQAMTFEVTAFGLDGTFYYSANRGIERAYGVEDCFYELTERIYKGNVPSSAQPLRVIYYLPELMKEGEVLEVYVPSDLAYGYKGFSLSCGGRNVKRKIEIPPNSPLKLQIRLTKIE